MAAPAQEGTLVGLCDGEIDTKRHQTSYLTNKVGGQPDLLPGIPRLSPRCGRCGAPLLHVVQVYCPLDVSPYHRHLHLFACPGAECSSGAECWRVLRSQCLEAEVAAAAARTPSRPPPAQEAPLAATDWCDTADDWGMEEEDGWGGEGGVKKDSQVQEEAAAPEADGEEEEVLRYVTEVKKVILLSRNTQLQVKELRSKSDLKF